MVYGSQYNKTLKSYLYLAINFIQSMIAQKRRGERLLSEGVVSESMYETFNISHLFKVNLTTNN